MERLTAMTIGAAMIGICGFAIDSASAQSPACPAHQTTVYFAPDSAVLNAAQDFALVTMANAARTCGAKAVTIETIGDIRRAETVAAALRERGIEATIIPLPALAPGGDTMMARSVTLSLASEASSSS